MVGQVLWRHIDGVEKDIRTLLLDPESEIKIYLASDIISHHAAFEEVVTEFRQSGRFEDIFRLKPIWVPGDFDADNESGQKIVSEIIKSQIVEDILFNVVFGKITSNDIHFFLNTGGIPGLHLAILYNIATEGFINIATLKKRLEVSSTPIREKLPLLAGAGLVETPINTLLYEDTVKGRVFLEIISQLINELQSPPLSSELSYILSRLGCSPVDLLNNNIEDGIRSTNLYVRLVSTIQYTTAKWGIDFTAIDYSNKRVLKTPHKRFKAKNLILNCNTPRQSSLWFQSSCFDTASMLKDFELIELK